MRRLLIWKAYQARDDRDRGVVHSRSRYFQDQAVMLGLLGRAQAGFAGPDSKLQGGKKRQTDRETASEIARFSMCGEEGF